jgi:alcohol dehydrogenase (cytochrome c)
VAALFAAALGAVTVQAQVTFERLLNAGAEPHNWLTYSGTYASQRHTALTQIRPSNVGELELKWVYQAQSLESFETSPLVVDGVMYLTEAPNTAVAVDARTGRPFWRYQYNPSPDARPCCGRVNRGLAMLGNTLFMATIDSKLIALDAITGQVLWQKTIADASAGYAMTLAPLVVKDKVIVGVAGGEYGIRGFIAAHDAATGDEEWRFYTIPAPGEPGFETWADGGDAWEHGGASVWLTGSYDASLDLTYWGIGNPGPDWNPAQRPGDNLYSDSVVALDPDTGELKWYFQFTPNDGYDYDSVQVPVLADIEWNGQQRRVMLWANRNGYFYVLDRVTGEFLAGTPFVRVNWSSGLDANGRPIATPQPAGAPTFPGNQGGTNWYPPSFSPRTGLFYFTAWQDYATIYRPEEAVYQPGRAFLGGGFDVLAPAPGAPTVGIGRTNPINNWTDEVGHGAVIAMDPVTREPRWIYNQFDVSDSGMLTTATDLLFTGGREGYLQALDARTGALIWKASLGGQIVMAPVTYLVDGEQYLTAISGNTMVTFGPP